METVVEVVPLLAGVRLRWHFSVHPLLKLLLSGCIMNDFMSSYSSTALTFLSRLSECDDNHFPRLKRCVSAIIVFVIRLHKLWTMHIVTSFSTASKFILLEDYWWHNWLHKFISFLFRLFRGYSVPLELSQAFKTSIFDIAGKTSSFLP